MESQEKYQRGYEINLKDTTAIATQLSSSSKRARLLEEELTVVVRKALVTNRQVPFAVFAAAPITPEKLMM